jgi:ABC-type Fe3+/spermidine/putrescine transport system ATPase subunit
MAPFLRLDRLVKSFGSTPVLRDLSLEVERGEVLALLGPSGSGKTTALRLIGGFERPDSGRVELADQDITALPPARRAIGMVFQHYALFPHLTVGENVAFGLAGRHLSSAAIRERAEKSLVAVDLAGFAHRRVAEISGGQQQRVALARALAPEPRLLLLDEPLSNLDPALRERTRRALKSGLARVGITTVLVTHEQEEAFHLGDRVAVLAEGVLHQVGTPEELYERPATRFVASFIGRASSLPGPRVGDGVRVGEGSNGAVWQGVAANDLAMGAPGVLLVRPEALRFAAPGTPGSLSGQVSERRYAGNGTFYLVQLAANGCTREVEVAAGPLAAQVGETVGIALASEGPLPRIFAAAAAPAAAAECEPEVNAR